MFDENEEEFLPPKEEEIPARLAKKWEERERSEGTMHCPGCNKMILAKSGFCPFCGDTLSSDRSWIKVTVIILVFIFVVCGVRFFMHN